MFLSPYCFLKRNNNYLFLFRERGKEEERERNISVVASCTPLLGTWPATQACALTGKWTCELLVCRQVLNPLSHTSQGVAPIVSKCCCVTSAWQWNESKHNVGPFWTKWMYSLHTSVSFPLLATEDLKHCMILVSKYRRDIIPWTQWMEESCPPARSTILLFCVIVNKPYCVESLHFVVYVLAASITIQNCY